MFLKPLWTLAMLPPPLWNEKLLHSYVLNNPCPLGSLSFYDVIVIFAIVELFLMFTFVVLGRSMSVVFGCSLVGGCFSVDALGVSPFEGVLDGPSRSWSIGLGPESL